MQIYKLNIFKGTFQHELDTMQEGFFINLGLADYVQAEKVNDFSQLVSYNPSEKIGEHRFLCSSMFIFDEVKEGAPLNPEKSGMPLLDTSLYKSNIFMICPIKLRLTSEIAPDAVKLYEKIRKHIEASLADVSCGMEYYVYACSGATDLVLIAVSNSFTKLNSIPWRLRNICENNSKMFSSVNSLYIFHDSLDAELLKDELCYAQIQVGFDDNCHEFDSLTEIFEDTVFKGREEADSPITYVAGSGEFDLLINLSKINLKTVLSLFGIGIANKKNRIDRLKWRQNGIRYTNTFLYDDLPPNLKFAGQSEESKGFDGTQLLSHIERLAVEIEEYIPLSSKHAVDILVDACKCLLDNGHQWVSGLRISCIVYYAFQIILKKHTQLTADAINFCLRDICGAANMALQYDSIQFSLIENANLDSFSSTSKFLFCYEAILQEAEQTIKNKVDEDAKESSKVADILMFFGIGHSHKINSRFYFRTGVSKLPKLVSVNLPNTQYYAFAFPYIFHELGHYVPIPVDERNRRNECYFKLIKDYYILYVYNNVNTRFPGAINIQAIAELMDSFWSLSDMAFDDGLAFDEFVDMMLEKALENTYQFLEINLGREKSGNGVVEVISSSLRSLTDDQGYAYLLDHTFREARADLLMLKMGELSAASYLQALFQEFDSNLQTPGNPFFENSYPVEADIDFQFRVAAVLLSQKADIDEIKACLSEQENIFFECVYKTMCAKQDYLNPLVDYLIYAEGNMPKINTDAMITKTTETSKIITILMEYWYKNILYWSEKARAIVKSCK